MSSSRPHCVKSMAPVFRVYISVNRDIRVPWIDNVHPKYYDYEKDNTMLENRNFILDKKNEALRFCLEMELMDRDFKDLALFLTPGSQLMELGGEPGYSLEVRNSFNPAHKDWPPGYEYRAYVSPKGFGLGCPEGFYTRQEFVDIVRYMVNQYVNSSPAFAEETIPVLNALENPSCL